MTSDFKYAVRMLAKASVKIAMIVKPGAFANIRRAYLKSAIMLKVARSLMTERSCWIELRRAAGRKITGEQCGSREQGGDEKESDRIARTDLIERRGEEARDRVGAK